MKAKNLVDLVWRSVARYPDKTAFKWKREGKYKSLTYREFWDEVRKVAAGLARLGVGRDFKVAILSENDPLWPISDLAICSLGAISVPIYPNLPAEQVAFILHNADCRMVFVQNTQQFPKIIKGGADVQHIVVMQPDSDSNVPRVDSVLYFTELAQSGSDHPLVDWENDWREMDREQVFTIIHTSGTTGEPKGAMLTHGNVLANIDGVQFWCLEARPDDVFLSYLPLSHVFERMAGQFMPLSVGATIAYAESIDTIPENLLEVRPTVMTSVPLLLEKVYGRVQEQIASGSALRRQIFNWALRVGLQRYEYYLHTSTDQLIMKELPAKLRRQFKLADRIVYRKIKARLGGRIRGFISGGAALNPEIARFFWAVDIPVLEGYGMTETAPVIATNPVGRTKIGTVGKPLPNLELRIADDGEIVVRGPNVMSGYYKNEIATAAQFTDGWLHTGDLGEVDEDGYLRIVGRKKSMLILNTGKNVAPQPVEHAINQSIYIQHSALIGHGRKYVIVLVVPDYETLIPWARKKGLHVESRDELIRLPDVQALLGSEVKCYTEPFPSHEQPKKMIILTKEWTVESGEITPTLKVRIHEIERKYKNVIDRSYSESSSSGLCVEVEVGDLGLAVCMAIRKQGEGK